MDLKTTGDAAEYFGVTPETIRSWLRSGRLRSDGPDTMTWNLFKPETLRAFRDELAADLIAELERLGYDVSLTDMRE